MTTLDTRPRSAAPADLAARFVVRAATRAPSVHNGTARRGVGRRERLCDLSYLRTPYLKADGGVGYRRPSEPADAYVRKGGAAEDTEGRRCLCNALVAHIGLGRTRADGYTEPPLLTLGQDLDLLPELLTGGATDYSAADAVEYLPSR